MVRLKQRYILCEIIPQGPNRQVLKFDTRQLYHEIKDAIALYHGDYGIGSLSSSLSVKYMNPNTHIAMVRAKRGFHTLALQAMTLMKKVGDVPVLFHTLHVAGTIRSCQKFLAQHQRQELRRLLLQCSSPEEKAKLRAALSEAGLSEEPLS